MKTKITPYRMLTVAVGAIIAVAITLAAFLSSTWSPPPQARLVLPSDFKHEWVILLEDPNADRKLTWRGYNLPFVLEPLNLTFLALEHCAFNR
jgi:hypothetical protein